MRPDLVAVGSVCLDLAACLVEADEPVLVQALVPELEPWRTRCGASPRCLRRARRMRSGNWRGASRTVRRHPRDGGAAFEAIRTSSKTLTALKEVSEIVADMAVAGEGAVGRDRTDQVNQVTQQNAASSEEPSSTASEIAGRAQQPAAIVATFRVESNAARDARSIPGRATAHDPTIQWRRSTSGLLEQRSARTRSAIGGRNRQEHCEAWRRP